MTTGLDALYPFLYSGAGDRDATRADVRSSTAAKALEIVELRRRVEAELGPVMLQAATAMAHRFQRRGRLYAFGNGGSSSDAQAVTQLFCAPPYGQPLPAIGLTADVATLTALANDVGFEVVFARPIAAFGTTSDIALGLSTSRGLLTVGLAGYEGGGMAALAAAGVLDYLFVVPSASVHRIQEAQTTVYDVLWDLTQQALD
jgi:D-sedoheptulose 7-phosphate isomerase